MPRYEVTIPFKPGPWYSVEVEAESKESAVSLATISAAQDGFTGKRGNAKVIKL